MCLIRITCTFNKGAVITFWVSNYGCKDILESVHFDKILRTNTIDFVVKP